MPFKMFIDVPGLSPARLVALPASGCDDQNSCPNTADGICSHTLRKQMPPQAPIQGVQTRTGASGQGQRRDLLGMFSSVFCIENPLHTCLQGLAHFSPAVQSGLCPPGLVDLL